MNLRDSARERACTVRLERVCNSDPQTTVLAHYRMIGMSGTAYKPPDLMAAFACSNCHDAVDRRRYLHLDREFVQLAHLRGVMRTQAIWLEEGLVTVAG